MKSSRRKFLTMVSLGLLLTAGCEEQIVQTLSEVGKLQTKLVEKFGNEVVNVNLKNGEILTVTFINSPLNEKSSADRAQRAQDTATFVTQHYPSVAKLQVIWVSFLKQESQYILFHYSERLEFFPFDNSARPIPTGEERSSLGKVSRFPASAVYVPHSNETEVTLPTLQLEGTLEEGLALVPRYSVKGDATSGFRRPPPPEFVSFDFASYSPTSQFREEKNVSFLADDKVVFEKKEVFATTKQIDGTFSEFLLMKVPYSRFRKLASAQTVVIRIGDKNYELNGEQIAGLQEMTKYVAK